MLMTGADVKTKTKTLITESRGVSRPRLESREPHYHKPAPHKVGNFGDVLPSQSSALVSTEETKLNTRQEIEVIR